jgi:hypothetical protein
MQAAQQLAERHRRAAEQCDELAAFHSIELHLLPQPGTSAAARR